jgi:hypothetical protein
VLLKGAASDFFLQDLALTSKATRQERRLNGVELCDSNSLLQVVFGYVGYRNRIDGFVAACNSNPTIDSSEHLVYVWL